MAKITITLEDLPDGKVKLVVDPTIETFFKMDLSGHSFTPAQGYAVAAVNHVHRESKKQQGDIKILLPKVDLGGSSY